MVSLMYSFWLGRALTVIIRLIMKEAGTGYLPKRAIASAAALCLASFLVCFGFPSASS